MFPQGNQPGAQVTGNEDDQFQQFLRDEIQKAVAQNTQAQPGQQQQAQPAAAPITLTLANGQTATFQDQNQLNTFWNNYQQQVAQLVQQSQIQPQVQQAPQTNQVTGDDAPDFSVDQFVEQVTKDPKKALVSGLKAAGYDLDELMQVKKQFQEVSEVLAVQQFKEQFPDFPANPQAAQIVNQVRQSLNLPFNFQGLAASYAVADKQGYFTPFRQQAAAQVQQQTQNRQQVQEQAYLPPYQPQMGPSFAPGRYPQAPPTVPVAGYSPAVDDWAAQAENMSTDQIEQLFDRLNRR